MEQSRRHSVRSDGGRPNSKVARQIEKYDLDGIGEELEDRWLTEGDRGMSLRELADFFSRRVLESAIEESQLSVLDVDVETLYEQLTADDVSGGVRTNARRRLTRNGVDVDVTTNDFVTHQSIHTYLREYRAVERPDATPDERRATAQKRVQKLQDRTAAVSTTTLESLQRDDAVPGGDFDVLVDIQVVFTESGEQHSIFDLLEA